MATISPDSEADTLVAWQPEPRIRGTFRILSACVFTLLLCTWTALHLNIPAPEKAAGQKWRKVGWMIMGLFGPELVAFTAWYQWWSSARLSPDMRSALGQPPVPTIWEGVKSFAKDTWDSIRESFASVKRAPSKFSQFVSRSFTPWPIEMDAYGEEGETMAKTYNLRAEGSIGEPEAGAEDAEGRRHVWSKTHSWYAVMGGFAVDMRGLAPDFIPTSPRFQILSPEGLLLLARCRPDLVPDISEEDIEDKSKADGLKKFIICIQASWFLVTTSFRLANGYPIALLEVNTFAHACCVLFVYFIWWNKPLDVAGSTLIDAEQCEEIIAFMAMASSYKGRRDIDILYYRSKTSEEAKKSEPRVRFDPEPRAGVHPSWNPSSQGDGDDDVRARLRVPLADPTDHGRLCQIPDSQMVLQMWQTLYGFCFEVSSQTPRPSPRSIAQRPYIVLREGDLLRWRCASRAVQQFLTYREDDGQLYVNFGADDADCKLNPERVTDLLVDRVHNWPIRILSKGTATMHLFVEYMAFGLAGASYGALHFIGQTAAFATETEKVLWRVSALLLLASGPGLFLLAYAKSLPSLFNSMMPSRLLPRAGVFGIKGWADFAPKFQRIKGGYMLLTGFYIILLWPWFYIILISLLPRAYIFVECFINLSRLEPKVFELPSWTAYWPHFS